MRRATKILGFVLLLIGILPLLAIMLIGAIALKPVFIQYQARQGLDLVLNELPDLEAYKTIKTVSFDSSREGSTTTCYYATDYLIIGTSLPELVARETYIEVLQSMGWEPGWKEPLPTRLTDKKNTIIQVTAGDPVPLIRHAVNYDEIRKTYQSIIYLRVDYMIPNTGDC